MLNNVCQTPKQCLALQFVEAKFVKPNLHKTPCCVKCRLRAFEALVFELTLVNKFFIKFTLSNG